MSDAKCPNCDAELELSAVPPAESTPVRCDACGEWVQVIVTVDGAKTVLHRQAADESAGGGHDSGTMVVDSETVTAVQRGPRTITRGALKRRNATPEEGQIMLRGDRVTVGRQTGEVQIPDSAMSAEHFEVERREGEFFIRDLASSNGTFVNDRRIKSAQLSKGDEIRAGRTTFTFTVVEAIALD